MIHSRNYASCFILGAVAMAPVTAFGGDYVDNMPVQHIADHCAQFGEGFVDVGNGICGRVSRHVRVYVGSLNAAMSRGLNVNPNNWPTSGTSSAALRSDGGSAGAEVTHLRVRGNLDSFDPFR